MTLSSREFLTSLDSEVDQFWSKLFQTRFLHAIMGDGPVDLNILKVYLIESYHYVKHNAQHQALAVWQKDARDRLFMKRALEHALEEVDHDKLALRDLESFGVDPRAVERSVPLPETLGFTGFLYYWVTRENPIGRLGYSLWAEGTQDMGPKVIARIKEKFDISDNGKLTFFVAHAQIDMRHGEECKENILRFAENAHDQWAIRTVTRTTMKLFLNLMDAMYERYLQVQEGAPLVIAAEHWPAERGSFERI